MTQEKTEERETEVRTVSGVVGLQVRLHRVARGLSQSDLSKRMNAVGFEWNNMTVSNVERDKRRVSVDEVAGLGFVFGVHYFDLLDPDGLPVVRLLPGVTDGRPDASKDGAWWPRRAAEAFLTNRMRPEVVWTTNAQGRSVADGFRGYFRPDPVDRLAASEPEEVTPKESS